MSFAAGKFDVDHRAPLGAYAKAAIAAAIGVALGLGATYFTTLRDYPFGAATSGPWSAWPRTGAADADPYARAIVSRRAESPLGNGEGIVFRADKDSSGAPLDGSCDYRIEGDAPVARLWTLAIFTPAGRIVQGGAGRHELTSAELLRASSGAADIVIAPTARPGNWLAAPKGRPFTLVLSLYDAVASPTRASLEALAMPTIRKGECQ